MTSALFKFVITFLVITASASPISSLEFHDINKRDCDDSCAAGAVVFCCGEQGFRCVEGNQETMFTCTVSGEVCLITPEGIGCGFD